MEIFEEIYSAYFQAVQKILLESSKAPLTVREMEELTKACAFEDSALYILPKLLDGAWSALLKPVEGGRYACALNAACPDLTANVPPSSGQASGISRENMFRNALKTPMTNLQKSWLKALLPDARFRLFFTEEMLARLENILEGVEPLFYQSDFHYFDTYLDGDPYEAFSYREHFQTILKALTLRRPLFAAYESAKSGGTSKNIELLPCRLQYSAKDDKFRLLAVGLHKGRAGSPYILNVNRILACHLSKTPVPAGFAWDFSAYQRQAREPVRIRIRQERNALERCMLHFASYEKHTEYEAATDTYLCSIYYDPADETELLIQLLSFGPVIEILGPEGFRAQARERVIRQHELFYGDIPG